MATLLLSAAGAALGGGLGGSFLGVGTAVLGKAIGATVGSLVDQKLMGVGSEPVETGRVERFRVMGSSEGAALPRAWGRVRLAGQIIWSSRFLEQVNNSEMGGKGGGRATVKEYSYSISLAIALCEGTVLRVGRIWADGQPLDQRGLNWRLYNGNAEQLPDPLIAAIEGSDRAPAYRGTAYVVIEDLDLSPFGNRIPQFNFEVFRRPEAGRIEVPPHPADQIRGVALIPGTGEYSLATEPVSFKRGKGQNTVVNVHNDRGVPDLVASLDQLQLELPHVDSTSLVVSWFGDDLRASRCTLRPKVEQRVEDGDSIQWRVAGLDRIAADQVSRLDGRPLFGGTPSDATVVQAIHHMRDLGMEVMFYPFILMDILAGNGLRDPWSGSVDQPVVPWRGRITLDSAPGNTNSSDKSLAAAVEIADFLGTAQPSDFQLSDSGLVYSGPAEWSYRRFILHYAHLCASAGGVKAFCIGSELRGLTQVRDGASSYPFVRALRELAQDVRSILGAECKIGYAADWSEYFGHQPGDGSGDTIFNLDPLWSHPDIDFIGIDNYMPLSDWRDGVSHADASAGSIYELDYLSRNVAGGEGYDWFYANSSDRVAQRRTAIRDTAYGEDWVFRYKDVRNWWSQPHVDRLGGVKVATPTAWVPESKPIWFTELGCPAVDKGTNQPNVFHDPKSSESFFPYFSNGGQDAFIQYRYLQATFSHWLNSDNNPLSGTYGDRMVDLANAYVWAWDARPWPDFPSRVETWIDGKNHALGHWINGRTSCASLAGIVAEMSERCDVDDADVRSLHGLTTGYSIENLSTGRQSMQPLMIAYGFDARTADGRLVFRNRGEPAVAAVAQSDCVSIGDPVIAQTRSPLTETPGSVTFGFISAGSDYVAAAVSSIVPDGSHLSASQTSFPLVLSEAEAKSMADRWLMESLVARDLVEFALPPSRLDILAGDVVTVVRNEGAETFRVDRVEEQGPRRVSAVRVDQSLYGGPVLPLPLPGGKKVAAPSAVHAEFLDLPLLKGNEAPHAPHVAIGQQPWSGSVAVYAASEDYGYRLNTEVTRPAVFGEVLDDLPPGTSGLWMNRSLRVRLWGGALQSRSEADVLGGANAAAVRTNGQGDWEVLQFRQAELVGRLEYELRGILRGQAGTDGVSVGAVAAGSDFVLLDSAVVQLDLSSSSRGLARHYRYGPARLPYDDPTYQHVAEAFAGVGLRPYSIAHPDVAHLSSGDIVVRWIRRTRIDGDSWQGTEVPLGEDREMYHVRVVSGQSLIREDTLTTTAYRYTADLMAEDGHPAALAFEIAQVSDRFGPGPYTRIES